MLVKVVFANSISTCNRAYHRGSLKMEGIEEILKIKFKKNIGFYLKLISNAL